MPSLDKLERVEHALRGRSPRVVALDGRPARAAVAVILDPREDDLHLLLIQRAVDERDRWSGQMGFPGGFREAGDPDLLATVCREVREEIGFDLGRSGRLLGRLDDVRGVARGRELPLVITPFVFALSEPVEPEPNDEVQGILWVPLSFLQDPASLGEVDYRLEGTTIRLPAFLYEGRTIWGLTFRMIGNFTQLLAGDLKPSG